MNDRFHRLGRVRVTVAIVAQGVLLAACVSEERHVDTSESKNRLGRIEQALQVSSWPDQSLVALNSVQFEDRAEFTGDVAVINASSGPQLVSGYELALGFNALLTRDAQADNLLLRNGAHIDGDAEFNGIQSDGTISGATTSTLSLPIPISVPALPTISAGTQDLSLASSESESLSPGAYGDVFLDYGQNGIVTKLSLTGGVYHLRSLTLSYDARLDCLTPCELRIEEQLSISHRSIVGPAAGAALGPGNVQILVAGETGSSPATGTAAALVDHDAELHAYLLAPNGTFRLGHRTAFTGKAVVEDAVLGFDSESEGLDLPLITLFPQDVTVAEGQDATFAVQVEGGAQLQWRKNGEPVPGATGITFTIPEAQAADNGAVVDVVVTNAAGTLITPPALLTVTVFRPPQSGGERPGEMRWAFGRPPPWRLTGSASFLSKGFNPLPNTPEATNLGRDTPAPEGGFLTPLTTVVRLHFPDSIPVVAGCPGSLPLEILVNGAFRSDLRIPFYPTCEPPCTVGTIPSNVSFVVPTGDDFVSVGFQVPDQQQECPPSQPFIANAEVISVTEPGVAESICEEVEIGGTTTLFCMTPIIESVAPVLPETRLCFQWGTSFVDEGFGEDVTGNNVFIGGAPTMDQRYPARFAEYQLMIGGSQGFRSIGMHYDDNGEPADCGTEPCGIRRFLDVDGCVPDGLIDPHIFIFDSEENFTFRARVRTRLGDNYSIQYADLDPTDGLEDERYQIIEFQKSDLDLSGWQLDPDLSLHLPPESATAISSTLTPATNVATALASLLNLHPDTGHPGELLEVRVNDGLVTRNLGDECNETPPPDAGAGVQCPNLQPCARLLTCEGNGSSCESNQDCIDGSQCVPAKQCSISGAHCSAATGSSCPMAFETLGPCEIGGDDCEGGFCVGGPECPDGTSCMPGETCPSGDLCSILNGTCRVQVDQGTCELLPARCQHILVDSAYTPDTGILHVGPANAPSDADACTQDSDCPRAQICLNSDKEPCLGGECYCHWAHQSRWKSVILHEAGHQLLEHGFGFFKEQGSYTFGDPGSSANQPTNKNGELLDPLGIAPLCGCDHISAANSSHCLQSVERFAAALDEGFAHFNAARTFNRIDDPMTGLPENNCTFAYYKELLGADITTPIDCETTEGLCADFETRETDPATGNPITRTLAYPPIAIDCETPLKWRDTFCPAPLPDLLTDAGAPIAPAPNIRTLATEHDFLQFFWSVYSKGTRATMADLYGIFLSACNNTQCTSPANCSLCSCIACTGQNPDVCDPNCPLAPNTSHDLRWAPIQPQENVPEGTVSLQTGAEAYFGQGSQASQVLQALAEQHGITPTSIP